MSQATIRDLVSTDVDAYIRLMQASFAEEMKIGGQTPEMAAQSIRGLARGKMIPFRALMGLTRQRYAILVAEVGGRVVGSCALTGMGGSPSIFLHSLMVLPEYRRQGISTALTRACLKRASHLGAALVCTTVLEHNLASLGNMHKCGFVDYRRSVDVEFNLPFELSGSAPNGSVRKITSGDYELLRVFEGKALGEMRLRVEGSSLAFIYPSIMQYFFQRFLLRRVSQTWLVEHMGQVRALARARTDVHRSKGFVFVETVDALALDLLALLTDVSGWLVALGKKSMGVTFPGGSHIPSGAIAQNNWVHLCCEVRGS